MTTAAILLGVVQLAVVLVCYMIWINMPLQGLALKLWSKHCYIHVYSLDCNKMLSEAMCRQWSGTKKSSLFPVHSSPLTYNVTHCTVPISAHKQWQMPAWISMADGCLRWLSLFTGYGWHDVEKGTLWIQMHIYFLIRQVCLQTFQNGHHFCGAYFRCGCVCASAGYANISPVNK